MNGPRSKPPPGRREKIVSSVSDSSYDTVKCLGAAGAFFYPNRNEQVMKRPDLPANRT